MSVFGPWGHSDSLLGEWILGVIVLMESVVLSG